MFKGIGGEHMVREWREVKGFGIFYHFKITFPIIFVNASVFVPMWIAIWTNLICIAGCIGDVGMFKGIGGEHMVREWREVKGFGIFYHFKITFPIIFVNASVFVPIWIAIWTNLICIAGCIGEEWGEGSGNFRDFPSFYLSFIQNFLFLYLYFVIFSICITIIWENLVINKFIHIRHEFDLISVGLKCHMTIWIFFQGMKFIMWWFTKRNSTPIWFWSSMHLNFYHCKYCELLGNVKLFVYGKFACFVKLSSWILHNFLEALIYSYRNHYKYLWFCGVKPRPWLRMSKKIFGFLWNNGKQWVPLPQIRVHSTKLSIWSLYHTRFRSHAVWI